MSPKGVTSQRLRITALDQYTTLLLVSEFHRQQIFKNTNIHTSVPSRLPVSNGSQHTNPAVPRVTLSQGPPPKPRQIKSACVERIAIGYIILSIL